MDKEKLDLLELKMKRIGLLMEASGKTVEAMLSTYANYCLSCDKCPFYKVCKQDYTGIHCKERWEDYLMGVDE